MMDDVLTQMWREIAERPGGPMAFRFYLQPFMAMMFAVRDGIKDAREGRPAYFWVLFADPSHRRERLREGWHAVSRIFLLAIVMDMIYQLIVLKELRPIQGLLVAVALAIVPYVLLRGPVNRIAHGVLDRRARHHG